MTDTANRSRQPKGVSTGGQFAAEAKTESGLNLGTAPAQTPGTVPGPDAPIGKTMSAYEMGLRLDGDNDFRFRTPIHLGEFAGGTEEEAGYLDGFVPSGALAGGWSAVPVAVENGRVIAEVTGSIEDLDELGDDPEFIRGRADREVWLARGNAGSAAPAAAGTPDPQDPVAQLPEALQSWRLTHDTRDYAMASDLMNIVDKLREIEPTATAVRLDYGVGRGGFPRVDEVLWRDAEGNEDTIWDDDDRDFYPRDMAHAGWMLEDMADGDGWVELSNVDETYAWKAQDYATGIQAAVAGANRAAAADRYAKDLAREVSIQERLAAAEAEGELNGAGEPYSRQDAEDYEDDNGHGEDLVATLRTYIDDETGELGTDQRTLAGELMPPRGDVEHWVNALAAAEAAVPFQNGGPGTLYAAPGVEVTTYTGREDGVPVIQVDTPGNPNRIRVNVNDGDVFDGRTD